MLSIRRFGLAARRVRPSGQQDGYEQRKFGLGHELRLGHHPQGLVRGKNRDVILPMMVLHRLDAGLEATKPDVLSMKANLDDAGTTNQDAARRLSM
jgi:hypothetical protein